MIKIDDKFYIDADSNSYTLKEKDKIQSNARKCGLSTTEYVKQRALGYEPRGIPPDALFVCLEKLGELADKASSPELNKEICAVLKQITAVYIELSRNTPLLVQLFFIYYGLPKIGLKISASVCGVVGLAFLGGSYMAEAFRSGLEAVEPIQTESAYSLGMNRAQTFRYVILPQAMSVSVPAFVANVIFMLKATSVFSAVSLMDLMFTAKDLIGLYYKTTEALFLLVVFYLIILLPVSILGSIVERRIRRAGFGD